MPSFPSECGGLAIGIDGLLLFADRGRWLEGHSDHNRLTIADPSLDAPGVVGGGLQPSIVGRHKGVVVLAAFQQRSIETGPNFKSLGGRQRHHSFGEVGFEFVEHRHAQTNGGMAHHAFDHPAAGITLAANGFDALNHPLGDRWLGAPNDVGLHITQLNLLWVDAGGFDGVDPLHPGQDFSSCCLFQQLFGDRTCSDTADGFPR